MQRAFTVGDLPLIGGLFRYESRKQRKTNLMVFLRPMVIRDESTARTLAVTPWDKTMVGPIEKAIYKSDLGLTPNTAGTVIRVSIPPLTEERRRDRTTLQHQRVRGRRVGGIGPLLHHVVERVTCLLQTTEVLGDRGRRGAVAEVVGSECHADRIRLRPGGTACGRGQSRAYRDSCTF